MAENISAVEHECQESVITKVDQRQDTAVGGGYEVVSLNILCWFVCLFKNLVDRGAN